uniref:Uncharacterized protein n=1 Tax=Peronospora matthiolae TaxID=2874970 RepID=A0AAV1T9L0_9STRA
MRRYKGELALWYAARRCNVDKLQQLVRTVDVSVQLDEPHPVKGTTPLMAAARKKHGADIVRELIALGAELDVRDTGKHQNTALHYAAYSNRTSQLELLLEAGADLLALNGRGHTALDVARLRGRKEAAAALTARLEIHRGWLRLRSKSMLGFWKRRWCVLLACNSKRTAAELCIFRSPTKVHPEAVLWHDGGSTRYVACAGENVDELKLDMRVAYQKLLYRRYSRYISSGRTYVHKANIQPREYVFECETASSRVAWMRAFDSRQRESDCTNTTFSSSDVGSPPTSSSSSRGLTIGGLVLAKAGLPSRGFQHSYTEDEARSIAARPQPAQAFRNFNSGSHVACNVARPVSTQGSVSLDLTSCASRGAARPQPIHGYRSFDIEPSVACSAHRAVPAQGSRESITGYSNCGETRPLPRASAPRLSEDELGFLCDDVAALHVSRTQRLFPVARVVAISGDPNEPEPVVRGRCIVCFENHRDAVCIPCGHVAGCYDCTRAVTQGSNSCPVCRAHVDGVVRINE